MATVLASALSGQSTQLSQTLSGIANSWRRATNGYSAVNDPRTAQAVLDEFMKREALTSDAAAPTKAVEKN
jgi:hypothetical protein